MIFSEIARLTGIKEYPEPMEGFYDPSDSAPACDLSLLDSLQRDYDLFGSYYDLARQCGEQLNKDAIRSAWVKTAAAYFRAVEFTLAKSVPVPEADGTVYTSMLPLYVLLPQIPGSMAEYRRRGFSEEEIQQHIKVYKESIAFVEDHTGLPGIDARYFGWTAHFAKTQIVEVEGLQYEMRTLPKQVTYLRENATGQVVPVMSSGTFHRTGVQALGSAGYTDEDGAFTCTFREDGENYYGHAAYDCVVSPEEQTFPKKDWQCLIRPGDPCLGMHIPAKADISQVAMNRSIAAAQKLIAERFEEFGGSRIYCSSWLLDPQLGRLLGENANITAFQNRYIRFPQKSSGMHVFGFAFPKRYKSFETLPEDSSLRRKLKQLYINGGYIYGYAGMIF